MAVDDALSDISSALGAPPQPAMSYSVAPTNGVDAALADLAKSPAQLKTELAPPEQPKSSIPDWGRFGITAVTRGLGGAADFLTDPLAPLRRIISPDLEAAEESAKFRPGEAAGNKLFQATGIPEYRPTTPAGRIGLAASEGVVGGAPFGPVAALLSGLGGVTGQTTQEATGSERLATAASLLPAVVAPAARMGTNKGVDVAKDALGPALSQSYREGMVGEKLRSSASDPEALQQSLAQPQPPQLVPGSAPTTFQLSGDQGIGQLERGQRTLTPAPFLERAGEQNAARVGQIQALAPDTANPGSVRDLLQQNLAGIDQQGHAYVQAAEQNARQAFEQAGGRLNPEDYGALMRDQLEAAKSATKRQESVLWKAIDPDGNLSIGALPVRQEAGAILKEMPSTAKPPEGEEKAIFGMASLLPSQMPFSDFAAMRGRLLSAIREEAVNGQTPALRRMNQLRSAMDDTISNAAQNAAATDPALAGRVALAQGTYGPPINAAANMGRDIGTPSPADNAGGGPQAVYRLAGTEGETGGGPGNASGNPGLQSQGGPGNPSGNPSSLPEAQSLAPFDADAAARYRAAADATRNRAQTYNNPQIGPALQERGGMYRMPESRIPDRFISSPEGVQAFLNAGGDRATLSDALVADLRRSATNADGTLNPTKYASWQMRRSAVLRELPSNRVTLDKAAGAQEAVDTASAAARQQKLDFERGAARHFLNAEPAQAVQSALASKNPVADFAELSRLVAGDADAKAGMQRALADHISRNFIGNTESGTSGVAGMKSDAFQTFLKRNEPALAQVFSPEQMQGMHNIAADLQMSNRSVAGSKIPGQSNTAQDLNALSAGSVLRKYLWQGGLSAAGGLAGYFFGGIRGAIEGAVAAGGAKEVLSRLRAAGIEKTDQLMTEALLNPALAQTLMIKASSANRPFIAARLRAQIGELAGAASSAEERKRAQ